MSGVLSDTALITPRHRAEWAALAGTLATLRALPLPLASATGAAVLRALGPRLGPHKRAIHQIGARLPRLSTHERAQVVDGMWQNIGRNLADFAHLDTILADPARVVEIIGITHVHEARARGRGVVILPGHFGNWELIGVAGRMVGIVATGFYRPLNNPLTDRLVHNQRALSGHRMLAKALKGAGSRRALALLKRGGTLVMIADQHFSGGVVAPLLGAPAMTTPAPYALARHTGAAVIPLRCQRLDGHRCRITCEPPLDLANLNQTAAVAAINAVFERWILDDPSQWLWLHRRWRVAG
jgi:KDO2-lipid IV(A) lauroyltransferase